MAPPKHALRNRLEEDWIINRERFIPRIVAGREGPVRIAEGTERAQALALALAEICSEDFLECLLRHKAALDEFGGQMFVGAARQKFDLNGDAIPHNEPGTHETLGFVVHYSKTGRLKGQPSEPDVPYGQEPPESIENGTPPEPVAVTPDAVPEASPEE